MKKLLGIFILCMLLTPNITEAKKSTKFKMGQFYEGTVNWASGKTFELPRGQWEMIGKLRWQVGVITYAGYTLVQQEEGTLKGMIELTGMDSAAKWKADVDIFVYEAFFSNKTDGCYERSEYYLVKVYFRGASFNCFKVGHLDPQKETYNPDRNTVTYSSFNTAAFRKWVAEKNIKLPPIMLYSYHLFYAPPVNNWLVGSAIAIDPEFYGSPKTKFGTEESSEYHRANIYNYPEHKKYMNRWIATASKRQKRFEYEMGAKERHKLDLSEYGAYEVIKETKPKTKISNSNLTKDLKELNELYKEGVLTKEEFVKAKKKLLN